MDPTMQTQTQNAASDYWAHLARRITAYRTKTDAIPLLTDANAQMDAQRGS